MQQNEFPLLEKWKRRSHGNFGHFLIGIIALILFQVGLILTRNKTSWDLGTAGLTALNFHMLISFRKRLPQFEFFIYYLLNFGALQMILLLVTQVLPRKYIKIN